MATLNELTATAQNAYQANVNRSLANRQTAAEKQFAFAALRSFLSLFVGSLRANLAVSDDDIEAMGLPSRQHHRRQPLPPPPESLTLQVASLHPLELQASVHLPTYGHPAHSQTRKAYHGFTLRYRKAGDAEWQQVYTTRLRLLLRLDASYGGQMVTLSAAWINPRLQHGPWSNEVEALVNP